MRLTLTHMLSFEANASPFSGLALAQLAQFGGGLRDFAEGGASQIK
jgi:hypothetical protein